MAEPTISDYDNTFILRPNRFGGCYNQERDASLRPPIASLRPPIASQTGTGDRTRASSLENALQAFDRGILLPTPSRGLSGSRLSELGNISTSPLYEVSGVRSLFLITAMRRAFLEPNDQ